MPVHPFIHSPTLTFGCTPERTPPTTSVPGSRGPRFWWCPRQTARLCEYYNTHNRPAALSGMNVVSIFHQQWHVFSRSCMLVTPAGCLGSYECCNHIEDS
mmetsp:Transcript_7106/g.12543  ORF Transcript_7106/g.12543 Transcript_7106/m.12543 type:complete len:100 (+) Transcript_7106:2962-3261(+)